MGRGIEPSRRQLPAIFAIPGKITPNGGLYLTGTECIIMDNLSGVRIILSCATLCFISSYENSGSGGVAYVSSVYDYSEQNGNHGNSFAKKVRIIGPVLIYSNLRIVKAHNRLCSCRPSNVIPPSSPLGHRRHGQLRYRRQFGEEDDERRG